MKDDWATLPDLAGRVIGGTVVAANDEFFAAADNLLAPEPPVFTPGRFGPKGQVYDGWETRRRREPGYDEALVRLGAPGVVRGVVVDTAFFTGNYPPAVSVEGCGIEGYPSVAELTGADWIPLVPRSPVQGDTRNAFPVAVPHRFTHVRLRIYPDGGVARLRVHGEVVADPRFLRGDRIDLAALENGGAIAGCSNMFYGVPANLIRPGLARDMGEGWETARRRDDGNDWVLVRLAGAGRIHVAELDTSHFKGNAPAEARLLGADARGADLDEPGGWFELLPRTRLQPDTRHRYRVTTDRPATHVRLDIYPDGGMARLRLLGELDPTALAELDGRRLAVLPPAPA